MSTKTARNKEYIPGVCNIGLAERRKRRMSGYLGLAVAIVLLVVLLIINAAWPWRLFLILPLTMAASGFLQDAFHFCAGFGMKGLYNVVNSVGVTGNVELEEFRQKDRRKALQILWLSLLIGVVLTAAALLI